MHKAGLGAGRGFVVALACVALVLGGAESAAAHGRATDATSFRAEITEAPELPGVRWEVYGGDELLVLENRSDAEITVLGYENEPYLRIGPAGVFENAYSPAVILNADRYRARVPETAEVDASAPPRWRQLSSSPTWSWHDHRIHWMSPQLPPAVRAAPDTHHTVFEQWAVPFAVSGEDHELVGRLDWVPGPNPWLWLLTGIPVALLALVGVRTRPVGGRWPGLARPAALVLGVVTLLNLPSLIDDLFAVPLPLVDVIVPAAQTALFLAIAAFAALRGWQARDGAFTALAVGSGSILVGQGLLYWSALGASQVTGGMPEGFIRFVVAASIVQALGLGVVAVVGNRAMSAEGDDPDVDEPVDPVTIGT